DMAVLPRLAAGAPEPLFLAFEAAATAGGLVVANGLYVLATFLLTLCLARRPGVPAGLVPLGYGVLVFGTALTVAGLVVSPRLAEVCTGPTILLYCAWAVLAARAVEPPRSEP